MIIDYVPFFSDCFKIKTHVNALTSQKHMNEVHIFLVCALDHMYIDSKKCRGFKVVQI